MNKRDLKSYMNNKTNSRELLKNKCFKSDDKYIISDSYSIIILNDNYGLEVAEDTYNINSFRDSFENGFEIDYTFFVIPEDNEDMYEPINENYGINIKLFKRINKVIKGNSYAILKNLKSDYYTPFIIKLENTKTKEVGYMLPMRKY